MVICCFIFLIVFFGYFFSPCLVSMFLPTLFSEPKSVAAREKELSELLAKATQPVCSSCHHQQQLPPSADAKPHESRSRDHFALNRGWHGACSKKYVRAGGGKVTKPTWGKFEWMETFPEGSRELLQRVSVFGEWTQFKVYAKHFSHHRAPEYGRGWKKKKVFKTSRRKEKMPGEKRGWGVGGRSRRKRIALFRLFKRRAKRDRLPWRPRPERPQPIGRDVGANEKALCWQVLRWLPGGSVRTGEYGWLWGGFLGSRETDPGKAGCQDRGSKCGRPHSLSAEP